MVTNLKFSEFSNKSYKSGQLILIFAILGRFDFQTIKFFLYNQNNHFKNIPILKKILKLRIQIGNKST